MHDVDYEYADLLLHVIEAASRVGGLPHLSAAAMGELQAMNAALVAPKKAVASPEPEVEDVPESDPDPSVRRM